MLILIFLLAGLERQHPSRHNFCAPEVFQSVNQQLPLVASKHLDGHTDPNHGINEELERKADNTLRAFSGLPRINATSPFSLRPVSG